jgi:hypothetical protein
MSLGSVRVWEYGSWILAHIVAEMLCSFLAGSGQVWRHYGTLDGRCYDNAAPWQPEIKILRCLSTNNQVRYSRVIRKPVDS